MRKSSLIALLFIGAVFYFVTGGGILLGLGGGSSSRSERHSQQTVTVTSDAQQNPFVSNDSMND